MLWRFPPFWPIDLRFPTNRSIGIVVGNLNLVREKELGFPSQKRVGFNLSLLSGEIQGQFAVLYRIRQPQQPR